MADPDAVEEVRPVPFVLVEDDGSFQVSPEATERLSNIQSRLVIVAVAGLYRTGKSFLLNLLVRQARAHLKGEEAPDISEEDLDAKGFAVGGTINACTKGIWMWGEPIALDDRTSILFLDTEGLGSTDREETHDTRIFALALLLASSFVYNSRGVIDGNAIEDLSLVVNLSKHIQTSSGSSEGGELHNFFPSFVWVVRDFTLQLQDNGKKISSKQYLENALQPQGGYSEDAASKDQIRSLLADFFRQRDCVTLVRPVDDEDKLRKLPEVPYGDLREEFRSSVESLGTKLFDDARPKTLYGKNLNGPMFLNLVQSYVEALNSGKAPVISNAWSRVMQQQYDDALYDAIEVYKKEMRDRVLPFQNPDQFDEDAGLEVNPHTSDESEALDEPVFDPQGNLRRLPSTGTVSEDSMESESIDVVETEEQESRKRCEKTRVPCPVRQLDDVHRVSKKVAKAKLKNVVTDDSDEEGAACMAKFRRAVKAEYATYKRMNAAASMSYCRQVLESIFDQVTSGEEDEQQSAMEVYRVTQELLQDKLTQARELYLEKAVGPSTDAAYVEFISQKVVEAVVNRNEKCNAAHMTEIRELERQVNQMSVKVAEAQGQANAMKELGEQAQQKSAASVKEAEQGYEHELSGLYSQLEFKTNELEHVLQHNETLRKLADTAQEGQYRATEFASSSGSNGMSGYLIKQGLGRDQSASRAKWSRRYFVLQGVYLSCYDTKDDYERQRADTPPINVSGASIEDGYDIKEAFSIAFPNNSYPPLQLHARSSEAKDEWVSSLRQAASGRTSHGRSGSTASRGSRQQYMQM